MSKSVASGIVQLPRKRDAASFPQDMGLRATTSWHIFSRQPGRGRKQERGQDQEKGEHALTTQRNSSLQADMPLLARNNALLR